MKDETSGRGLKNYVTQGLKIATVAAVAIGVLAAFSACSTVQGIGKDVEKAGEAIQKSAK